jgi:hypothetical protein
MNDRIHFAVTTPKSDRIHYVTEEDVQTVLSRLPESTSARLRVVHLNDRSRGRHPCAYIEPGRREIALCALPPRVSLSSYLVLPRQSPRLFGASRGRKWPKIAVRRFIGTDHRFASSFEPLGRVSSDVSFTVSFVVSFRQIVAQGTRLLMRTRGVGNKMGTGLAILAQCDYNMHRSRRYRNRLKMEPFHHHCNVFPIPQVWQTRRTQNPVPARGCGFKSHIRY